MALFMYGTASNTGKGFFTVEDRRNFFLRGYGGHDGSNYVDVSTVLTVAVSLNSSVIFVKLVAEPVVNPPIPIAAPTVAP